MERNNMWTMTAKDKDGNTVIYSLRGPERIAEAKLHGQVMLNTIRQREWDNTGEDPGWVVDKLEPAGHSDQAVVPIGEWRPPGAQPVNIPLPVEDDRKPRRAADNK